MLRYPRETILFGILYGRVDGGTSEVVGYVDTDYASDLHKEGLSLVLCS